MQLKLLLPGGIGLQSWQNTPLSNNWKFCLRSRSLPTHVGCMSYHDSRMKWCAHVPEVALLEPCQFQQCGAPHRSAIGRGGRNGRSCWNVQQLGNFDSYAIFMTTPTSTLGIGPDGKSKSPLLPGGVWMVSGWCLGRPGKSASKVRAWRWWPHGRICDFLCGIFTPGTKWQLEDSLRNFIHRLRAKKLLSFTSGTPDVTEVAPSLSTGRAMYYGLATMHHLKNENNQNCPSQS